MKHNVLIKNVEPNCYAASVLLHNVYKKIERSEWERARDEFLNEQLKLHGKLTCCYCGSVLKRRGGRLHEKATVDHKVPVSEGGDMLDKKNFLVSCDGCNRKKSNTSFEEFIASKYLIDKKKEKA
jgi:5-methylcytosine-specific restriction endonuclease McrA